MARIRKDNVIYPNFGAVRRRAAHEPETSGAEADVAYLPQRADRHGGAGEWILAALSERTDSGRVKRGIDYVRQGNVVDLTVSQNTVEAHVAGSQPEPFSVRFRLTPLHPADEEQFVRLVAENARILEDIARGRPPTAVLDELLRPDDLRTSCSCPDTAFACKHVIAVAELLAERLDADPHLLLRMRGFSPTALASRVAEKGRRLGAEAASADSSQFWDGKEFPELPTPKVAPAIEDSDTQLLQQALRSQVYTALDQLRAVAEIEEMYDYLVDR